LERSRSVNEDIRPIISGWPYRPGKISVRKIVGDDGKPRIQMRLDLGLIQIEPTGRPDGERPNGFESLLDYQLGRLDQYRQKHKSDLGFELSPEEAGKLREEALMYYHRYLACFILEEYDQVIRDTQRNIEVFDLCNKYAARKTDRMLLEQYRPYVLMMNTRAKAYVAQGRRHYGEALGIIKSGLRAIKKIYIDADQTQDFKFSLEASILRQLGRRIKRKLPTDPVKALESKLRRAIREERFEDAAQYRDQLERMRKSNDHAGGE